MLELSGTLLRGGTSKCWIFDAERIDAVCRAASGPVDVDSVLLAAFGAADPRQIDGVGGATSTTSKAIVLRHSARPGVDVEYTFAQVGIGANHVEWGSNCGNCATAAGLYAVQTGLVAVDGERTVVRLYNINTGSRLTTTVDTPGGRIPEVGAATVPGVDAGGVPVDLSFLEPAGGSTGALLPTGHPVDLVTVAGSPAAAPTEIHASLVDAGAPAVLADARELGLTAVESVEEIAPHVPRLADLRRAAALAMGLAAPADPVSYAVPKVGVVGPPADYATTHGRAVRADEYDLAVRMVSMHSPHPAIGLTSAVAVAAAATVPGSIVAELRAPQRDPGLLRLGTPAGVVPVRLRFDGSGQLAAVTLARAARRLAVAAVSVPLPALAHHEAAERALPTSA